jgi:protein-tyrosine phosphatase
MFRHLADQANVSSKYEVDSAGTSKWHIGEGPDPRMREVAARHGFQYDGRARQITVEDLEYFDLLIAMDKSNKRDLLRLAQNTVQEKKIRMLREFDPEGDPEAPVPDPYYGGIEGFERVFQVVKRSCRGLLEAIEEGNL